MRWITLSWNSKPDIQISILKIIFIFYSCANEYVNINKKNYEKNFLFQDRKEKIKQKNEFLNFLYYNICSFTVSLK